MPHFRLPRRAFLRGAGGIALALPAMEIMLPRNVNAAAGAPCRYVFAFGGSSIGGDRDQVVPMNDGTNYDLTRGLQPIGDLGIQDHVSVATGLYIPWGADGSVPAGGRTVGFHASSLCPLICGVRKDVGSEAATGPTSDQVAADTLAEDTPHRVLTYRVQPAFYRGSNGTGGTRGRLSARLVDGTLEHIDPNHSPRLAFESLFSNFLPPDDAGAAAEAEFLLRRRKSVVDLVRSDTESLVPRLGAADKIRLERHLDELRGLEGRLELIQPPSGGVCELPQDPGEDPAIGGAVENGDTGGYAAGGAYSDEELRASVMIDMIHMAFACDLSRVASLMFTWAQCFLNMQPIAGHPSDLHEIGHFSLGGGDAMAAGVADGIAWHVKHWGRLIQKLQDTIELDGTPMLDKAALVLTFEGGRGFDPEGGDSDSTHSTENMVALIGGHAGGLNAGGGQHIRNTNDRHPVEVVNTAFQAVGVDGDLGEVTGHFAQLLG